MDTKSTFLFFGIALALFAVTTGLIGLRFKNFPSRGAMIGMLLVGVVLVAGTATFGVKLQIQEAQEREEGEQPVGEEANITPLQIPADLRV